MLMSKLKAKKSHFYIPPLEFPLPLGAKAILCILGLLKRVFVKEEQMKNFNCEKISILFSHIKKKINIFLNFYTLEI